jgi:tRNA threonylcarbamoyladenosine modification (KEOPS) complex Cgi121 subunit
MTAYKLNGIFDLRSTARSLPEGVVVCDIEIIAGPEHIEGVLKQAAEYWDRNETLAKNRSIDLLMRITCKKQIIEAVSASGLSRTGAVAIFGYVGDESHIEKSEESIRTLAKDSEEKEELLSPGQERQNHLKEFHKLPGWLSKDQLLIALKEKSVLLIFAK